MPYVKLDCGITESSIWMEDSDTFRVWIYLLTKADATGTVSVTPPVMALHNRVNLDRLKEILSVFCHPDPDSRDPENDGCRIYIHHEPTWAIEILNYQKYRAKHFTNAEKQKAYRERDRSRKSVTKGNKKVTNRYHALPSVTQAEAEAEVQAKAKINTTICAEAQNASTQEAIITIPISKPKGEYPITQKQVDSWISDFPAVNVMQELHAMRSWCNANPDRCKTARGISKFIVGWLIRAQDKGRVRGGKTYGQI